METIRSPFSGLMVLSLVLAASLVLVPGCRIPCTVNGDCGQADYCVLAKLPTALIKPTTFMNRSGNCVRPWTAEHDTARWIVVGDDISMAAGKLRLRRKGSGGGHRGLESIINALGTEDFMRLKIGVGEPPAGVDAADWVLNPPSPEEEGPKEQEN